MPETQAMMIYAVFGLAILAIAFNLADMTLIAMMGLSVLAVVGVVAQADVFNAIRASSGSLALLFGGALPTSTALSLSGVLLANNGSHTVGGLTGASTGLLYGGAAFTFTVNKVSGSAAAASKLMASGRGRQCRASAAQNSA